jgi:hypothetical protein
MVQPVRCAWLLLLTYIAPPAACSTWQREGSEGAWAGCGRLVWRGLMRSLSRVRSLISWSEAHDGAR